MTTDADKSLSDEATLAGAGRRRPVTDVSLGDERTLGAGDAAGVDTIIDDIEVIDLEARYKFEDTLGQGGMGAVLLATDTRLGRKVAVKRILGEAARSKTAILRFLTEAKAIATLNHPNIVQIYDYGRAKDGPFLIMEYVDGGSLADRCREGALALDAAVDIACQICDGLAKAHDSGIVHRDIKPANVLVNRDGLPKLTDFGLAKTEVADHGMTMTGAIMGTPDYMPPEQRRDATEVDHRSDLWSLAATVYQMVTGRSPKIIRFNDVPGMLQDVLSKALEDRKEARYQSAREFRDALRMSLRSTAAVEDLIEGACPSCGVRNESSRRFCRGCGGSLEAPCLSCDKPMPMWEEICGSCGAKQTPLVEERRHTMAAKQAEAEGLLGDFDFDGAARIALVLLDQPHQRLRHLTSWAEDFLKQVQESQRDQMTLAAEVFSEAVKHESACDYLSAISALESIPGSLRVSALPGMRESAEQMLDRVKRAQAEVRRLESLIKDRLAARELDGLLPAVEELLTLRPDRDDLQKVRRQLLERQHKQAAVRDAAIEEAGKHRASHDYEAALAVLMAVPAAAVTPQVVKLREQVETLVRKARSLTRQIREAVAGKRFDGLLATVEQYLDIKPGDGEVSKLRQSLLEREQKYADEIASRLEQAVVLEAECRFDDAARTLARIPESRRPPQVLNQLERLHELARMRKGGIAALSKTEPGARGAATEACRGYVTALASYELTDPEFATLLSKVELAHAEELRARRKLFAAAATAAGIVAAVGLVSAGIWIHSSLRSASLTSAVAQSRWDDALAIDPENAKALVGRARARLATNPADVTGALADLVLAERRPQAAEGVKAARADAIAVRAKEHVVGGRLDDASRDLSEAERSGASEPFLSDAKTAVARGWIAKAQQAIAKGDTAMVRGAVNKALSAKADKDLLLRVWKQCAAQCAEKLDVKGLAFACVEGRTVGLNDAEESLLWTHLGMLAAAPPHENADIVQAAGDAALAAGAEQKAVLAIWRLYADGRLAKLDPKGLTLACATARKVGLGSGEESALWIRLGKQAVAQSNQDSGRVRTVVDAASAAGLDRKAQLAIWQEYAAGRLATLDLKGLSLACMEGKKVGMSGEEESGWWLRFGMQAAVPPHENAGIVRAAVDAALAAGAMPEAVAPLQARGLVLDALAANSKGEKSSAVSKLLAASLLDPQFVETTLTSPHHATLRHEVVEGYRVKFDEAVTENDWDAALRVAAAAETLDKASAAWIASEASALPPAAIATCPPTVLARLPPDTLVSLPPIRNSIGMQLKLLPAGIFTHEWSRRSFDEKPEEVRISSFYIGVHEVTNAQWRQVMESVPSRWRDADRPVEQVSQADAIEFCRKLSALPKEQQAGRVYRLPTEAEWEYACRAGTKTEYSFGDDASQLGKHGWFQENARDNASADIGPTGETHPVGRKKPNPWGLYDMHGNVFEMCAGASKTIRGGSFEKQALWCRSRFRVSGFNSYDLGLRIAVGLSTVDPPNAAAPEAAADDSTSKQFVVDMKPMKFQSGSEQGHYSLDGRIPVDKYGKVDHGPIRLAGNPSPKSFCVIAPSGSFSQLTFEVPQGCVGFQAGVGMADTSVGQRSPITFRVLDDNDEVLWSSAPLDGVGSKDVCQISVRGKKAVTLRVECPGDWYNAHAIWVEPQFTTNDPKK